LPPSSPILTFMEHHYSKPFFEVLWCSNLVYQQILNYWNLWVYMSICGCK
jgi:hypothetical protein